MHCNIKFSLLIIAAQRDFLLSAALNDKPIEKHQLNDELLPSA